MQVFLAAIGFLLSPVVARTEIFLWTGASDADWKNARNWTSLPSYPGVSGSFDVVSFGVTPQSAIKLQGEAWVASLLFTAGSSGYAIGWPESRLVLANGGRIELAPGQTNDQKIVSDIDLSFGENGYFQMVNGDKTHKLVLAGDIGGGKGNQHETQLVEFLGGGQFEIRGMISDLNSESLGLRMVDSTVTFYTASRHTGDTTVVNSRLVLGSGDVISHLSKLVLDGSTLETNGFDDLLGALRVMTESIVDFGSGDSDLWFKPESGYVFDAPLSLLNFDIGIDSMRFGTSGGSLDEEQLSFIRLPGYSASLDDLGYVQFTAVPEPAAWILAIVGLAIVVMKRRPVVRFRGGSLLLVHFALGIVHAACRRFQMGGNGGTSWNDAKNWSAQRIPGLNDDVWFDGSRGTTVDLGAGASIHDLNLSSGRGLQYKIGAYPIGSQTLTFQDNGGLFNSSGNDGGVTFVADVVLGGNGTTGPVSVRLLFPRGSASIFSGVSPAVREVSRI